MQGWRVWISPASGDSGFQGAVTTSATGPTGEGSKVTAQAAMLTQSLNPTHDMTILSAPGHMGKNRQHCSQALTALHSY